LESGQRRRDRPRSFWPTFKVEIFRAGIIEAIIELGRMQLELVPKNGED